MKLMIFSLISQTKVRGGLALYAAIFLLAAVMYLAAQKIELKVAVEAKALASESLTRMRYFDQLDEAILYQKSGKGQSGNTGRPWWPVSDELRIIMLDKDDYENSYTLGNWTPRQIVAEAMELALDKGARVLLVDFWLEKDTPIVLERFKDGTQHFLDDSKLYLERLEHIFQKAAALGGKIIFARRHKTEKLAPVSPFYALVEKYHPTVSSAAQPSISWSFNGSSCWARFASTEPEKNGHEQINLSAALSAYRHFREISGQRVADSIKPDALYLRTMEILPWEKHEQLTREGLTGSQWPISTMHNKPAGSTFFYPLQDLRFADAGALRGKLVLIGGDHAETEDFHPSPFGPISGSYLVVNELNMLLTGVLPRTSSISNILLNIAVLAALVAVMLILRALLAGWVVVPATFLFFIFLQFYLSSLLFRNYNLILEAWLLPLIMAFLSWVVDCAQALRSWRCKIQ